MKSKSKALTITHIRVDTVNIIWKRVAHGKDLAIIFINLSLSLEMLCKNVPMMNRPNKLRKNVASCIIELPGFSPISDPQIAYVYI